MITLVVEAAARSLALGLLIWIALSVLRPRNPHLHKTVWITVVLASLAMPFLIRSSIAPAIPAPVFYTVTMRSGGGALASTVTNWADAAIQVYALVVLVLAARFATGLVRMWRIRRAAHALHEAWTQADDVRVSAKLFSPATFGSTILLPAGFEQWSSSKLAAVLAHERSHVRQKDCHMQWLARLHACVFWINPLAWWIQRRLAELAETTSDDDAVQALGDRPAYAEVLLELAAAQPASRVVMAAARPNVSSRIERIISEVPPAAPPRRVYRALSVATVLPAVAISAASLQMPPLAFARADGPPQGVTAPGGANGADADDPMRPRLVSSGPLAELKRFYPAAAMRRGIDGLVQISITLDSAGRVTDTLILDEHPLEVGFGAAASALVHTFEFSNPTGRVAQLNLRVKFELDEGHHSPTPASDSDAPQAESAAPQDQPSARQRTSSAPPGA